MDTGLFDENNFGYSTMSPGYIFTFYEFISRNPSDTRTKLRTVFVKGSDSERVENYFNRKLSPAGRRLDLIPYLEPGEFDEFLKKGLSKKEKITNIIKDILHGRIIIRSRENALREV